MYNYNKKLVARDFSRAASRYDDYAELQRRSADRLLALAEDAFPIQGKVLDMGCGTGYVARKAPAEWAMTQVDIAEGMCRRAADAAPTFQGDMESLPFADGDFDAVISSLALQWTNPAKVFAEVFRVLQPGGKLAISTLGPETFQELRTVLAEETGTPHTSHFPERAYLEAALAMAGFGTIRWQQKLTRELWPDALALMRGIKAMGAANKNEDRFITLSEKQLKAAATRYREDYPAPGGVYATWQAWYMLAEKQ